MSLARTKALKDQVDRLQTENLHLQEKASAKSVSMGIRIAGENESDRLREEVEDLKDDMARKDLSIKNMDVLLKGLLAENEKLKSKQARAEEMMDAAVQREQGLVQKVRNHVPICHSRIHNCLQEFGFGLLKYTMLFFTGVLQPPVK